MAAPRAGSMSFSSLETKMAPVASPMTLMVVRAMSMILSTPATRAMASSGMPTWVKTMVIMMSAAPGTPMDPMEASRAMSSTTNCLSSGMGMP